MNSSVTRLDQMLYAWLATPDEQNFERAFEPYYAEASRGLLKYLARRSNLTDVDLEQIAVDALLKFFSRVGRERRAASESIAKAMLHVQPLDFGVFHVRLVRRWVGDITAFRDASMGFVVDASGLDAGRNWKAEIESLTDNIQPLQRQGCHLLETVRVALDADAAARTQPAVESEEESPAPALMREFVERLSASAARADASTVAAAQRYPGVVRFVDGSWTIINALPTLRVPTNGYLFDIAQSLYLDECKARGRKKRGGMGSREAASRPAGDHPLERIDLDADAGGMDGAESAWAPPSAAMSDAAVDPLAEQMSEDFCEKFYAYLCRPLAAAQEAYEKAAAGGSAKAERKRLESISAKMQRVTDVLTMRVEGETQEAIAEALGISRNQVKYIVEQIQSAHAEFSSVLRRSAPRPSTTGENSHVG